MTTERRTSSGSRTLYWLIGSVAVGWLVVYNAMRLAGSNPADAAWPSLGIGAVVGLAAFGAGLLFVRRRAAAGHPVRRGPIEIPSPSEFDAGQRRMVDIAWPALGVLAAAALVMGVYLGADWLGTDPDDRATTTIILAAWNVLVGLWLGDEVMRMRRGEADGVESIVLGCALTAVLAGVGLSRDLAETAQVVLIVLAGVAGTLCGLAAWRLQGGRGVPVAAIGVAVVAALSLILPIAL
ncbi:MAG: hypothetical protein ACAH79_11425 [Thermoleophilia bacterium]